MTESGLAQTMQQSLSCFMFPSAYVATRDMQSPSLRCYLPRSTIHLAMYILDIIHLIVNTAMDTETAPDGFL
jgi:hypothetical protein